MKKSLILLAIVLLAGGIWLAASRAGAQASGSGVSPAQSTSPLPVATDHPPAAVRDLGASDVAAPAPLPSTDPASPLVAPPLVAQADPAALTSPVASPPAAIPAVPPVARDANAQVASVVAAVTSGTHPERLSSLAQPAPFQPASYAKDPLAYLNVAEPGRAFQTAAPGPGVPRLEAVGGTARSVPQDGEVVLYLRAQPGQPVTVTSFDLGQFQNQLTTITVAADDQGVAAVSFHPGPGTTERVAIQAASPVCAGLVQFQITVLPPGRSGPTATPAQ